MLVLFAGINDPITRLFGRWEEARRVSTGTEVLGKTASHLIYFSWKGGNGSLYRGLIDRDNWQITFVWRQSMTQAGPEQPSFQLASQELVPEVAQLATDHQLGSFFKAFRADRRRRRNSVVLFGVIVAIADLWIVLNIAPGDGSIAMAGPLTMLWIIFLFLAFHERRRVVYLFQNGIICDKSFRGDIIYTKEIGYEVVPWQHIKQLKWRKRSLTDPAWFKMRTTNGRGWLFHYLENPEELYEAIEQGYRSSPHS